MSSINPSPTAHNIGDLQQPSNRRGIRSIAWLAGLLLLSIFGLMIPLPDGGRILPKIGDMAHGPLFAGITAGLGMTWNYLRPSTTLNQLIVRMIVIAILAFGFGGLTEVAQGLTGRTASLHDLAADSCGIIAACCFLVAWNSGRFASLTKKSAYFLSSVGISCIALSWLSPLASINDALAMKREFPLLASFERKAELERWHFANCHARRIHRNATSEEIATTDGDWALEVSYQPGSNSSATMYELQSDWTQAGGLVIDAFALRDPTLPSDTVELAVQIIDAHHDEQFQDICRTVFKLKLGERVQLRIPKKKWITIKGRPLDLEKILYLDLQLASRPAKATVCFDAVRLFSE